MKVLVNALPLRYGGGVTYLQHQIAALARVSPDIELHTLLSPWTELDGLPGTSETVQVRSVSARFAYEQLRLPMRQTDVLYCPANFGPLASRAPMVLTIHNAHYYRAGLALNDTRDLRPPWKVKANHLAMKRADAIVAVSNALAADAIATVPEIAQKLHVIQSGSPEWPEESEPLPGLPDRYLLSVANSAAHKRVGDVVTGWVQALDATGDHASLVLVGEMTDEQVASFRCLAGEHLDRLVCLGSITQRARLKWLYEHAIAMVLMSALESFSFTPIEAGSVGCPVVLSDLPAHREVAGSNGRLVPPGDTNTLTEVLIGGFEDWEPGSQRWEWPVTWKDNAQALAVLFGQFG